MSGKALLPGFGDDEEDTESQITQTVAEVSTLFKQAQLKMKLMGSHQGEAGGGDEVIRAYIIRCQCHPGPASTTPGQAAYVADVARPPHSRR